MEALDEILDLDELQEEIVDETLKEFMKKDEEAENLLKEKINEIINEEEKLNAKEEEIKKLEESNREKISSDASPEELIEIANMLKEAREELNVLTNNITNLETERENLIETKEIIEKSKLEYIKSLNATNSNYEEQLRKINEAIEVCDNPTLKQVFSDVKEKKDKELTELQEKRNNELKTVLKETDKSEEKVENNDEINIDKNLNNEVPPMIDNLDDNLVNIDDKIEENLININTNLNEESMPILENPGNNLENKPEENLINIDTILSNINSNNENISETSEIPNLNVVKTDPITLSDNNMIDVNSDSKIKIIFDKDVPNNLMSDIYSSSKIMPVVYDYLNGKLNKGGVY